MRYTPLGVFVKLANGETAIVIQRGAAANTPLVSSILNKNCDALSIPARRDTSLPMYAITSVVEEDTVRVQVSVDALYDRGKT